MENEWDNSRNVPKAVVIFKISINLKLLLLASDQVPVSVEVGFCLR
jgi:hypothetical protein